MGGKKKNRKRNKMEDKTKIYLDNEEVEEEEEIKDEFKNKKCSMKDHKDIDAIIYCQQCRINMCNKCEKLHSELFKDHYFYNLNEELKDIFTGFCKEKKHHQIKYEYFCKTHNQLCCASCLCKIKGKGNGNHKDCDVCFIKYIEGEKKKKLDENMKFLEDLSNVLESSINELKQKFEKIIEKKENLKLTIQKIFTKIRNEINVREDQLLLDVDKNYDLLFYNEDMIKEYDKLPNKVKILLEKCKIVDKEWNDKTKLNSNINDCINIEANVQGFDILNKNVINCTSNNNLEIIFNQEEKDINKLLEKIKNFGGIFFSQKFKFKPCPIDITENKKYTITGDKENIITKTGANAWSCIICENELDKSKEFIWKIKILKSNSNFIMVGVAPNDYDIKSSIYNYNNYGWYFYCYNSTLYSGPPYNYSGKETNLSKVKDEITIVMNMNNGNLKFIIDNEDKGISYTNIPLNKPIVPVVFLNNSGDSVEIINY